jgi:hypothetical protein
MAQTGFTPLQIYSSPTTTNVPLAANLVAGELAINTADGKLFYKDSSNVVQVLATKGGVGSSTTTQVLYNNSGLVVGSANLTFDGTKLTTNTLGAFTLGGTVSGGGNQINNVVIGASTPLAGNFTTLGASGAVTLSGGTANGVAYLNGSNVLTTGFALTFDGTNLGVGSSSGNFRIESPSTYLGTGRIGQTSMGLSGSGYPQVGYNFRTTSTTDVFNYDVSDVSSVIQFNNGQFIFKSATSGTTGAAISYSEQMRLTSTGLGIGTATPAYRLTVEGTLAAKRSGANQYIGMSTTAGDGYIDTINTLSTDYIGFNFRQTNNAGTVIRATLDASGNLGLGVTPSALWGGSGNMQFTGGTLGCAGTTTNFRIGQNEAYGKYITSASASRYEQATGVHYWLTAPSGTAGNPITFTQAMTLDASGNLGIGTATPGYKLDVSSTSNVQLRLQNSDATSYASMLFTGTGRSFSMGVGNSSETGIQVANQFYIYDNTAGATRLRIDSSGNLGLGVTPSAWGVPSGNIGFDIGTYASFAQQGSDGGAIVASNAYKNTVGNWFYRNTNPAGFYGVAQNNHKWYNAPSGTAGNPITFTQAMTLDASGNLGIGTSSPGNRLVVRSSGTSTAYAGNIGARFESNGAGYSSTIQLSNNVDASATIGLVGSNLAFGVGTTEMLRLDASGNLGLGVTPSAWASPGRINVPDAGALIAIGNAIDVGTNWYYNAGFKYATTNTATWYQQTTGKHIWYTAPSGTAGAAVTFTQAMTLDASGNLLVGTTSAGGRLKSVVVPEWYTSTTAIAANLAVASDGTVGRSTSSLKYKTDVVDSTHGLASVLKLRSVTYRGINNGATIFGGLIAEEVDEVGLTEFVQYADDGTPDALAYGQMVSLAFKAIQEQQAMIEDLQTRLAAAGI